MRFRRPTLSMTIAMLAITACSVLPARFAGGQEPAVPPPAEAPAAAPAPLRATDLAWLAGAWRGELGGAPIEEHWTAPDGGVMVGLFHWRRDPPLYEILLVEDTPEGAVMRLRHFGRDLVAWEEKDAAVVFRPVAHGPCWALFAEEGDEEERTRLRYERQADGGLLIQVIERRGGAEGADGSLDFRYQPLHPAAVSPCTPAPG